MKLQEIENLLLQEQTAVVPIQNNSFVWQSRKFIMIKRCEDGWHRIVYDNDDIRKIERLSALQTILETKKFSHVVGYRILDGFVFRSFSQEKLLTGNMAQQHQVFFAGDRSDWDMINAIRWEDGSLYYCQDHYCDDGSSGLAYVNVFERFRKKESLEGLKNVTPEMRLVYILASLERERIELELKLQVEKQAKEEFLKTLKGRLIGTLRDAGAEYISHRQQGIGLAVVIWKVAGRQFNSVIRTANFGMQEAGFCMSGHDKEHTLASAVNLVRSYIEDDESFMVTRS